MEGERKKNKNLQKCSEGFVKGTEAVSEVVGSNIKIKYQNGTRLNVIDKGTKNWIFRVDTPHEGVPYNHLNINPKITGIPDPHLKLPPGAPTVAVGTAKVCQAINKVNKVLVPAAIIADVVFTGIAIKNDVDCKTSRNTVESLVATAGGWAGGFGGAAGAAAIGTAICPGIGTIIGGIIGGIAGGVGASFAGTALVEVVGNKFNYCVRKLKCKRCGVLFIVRLYRRETFREFCPKCR